MKHSSMSHSSIYFPHLLFKHIYPVPPCTTHIILLCEIYFLLLCHTGTPVHLLRPPPGYWYTSFFFLAGPGYLLEIAVAAFSRSPLGCANTLSFLLLRPISRTSLKCFFFRFHLLFLSANLSLLPTLSCASALYLPHFSVDITSSWFLPLSFHGAGGGGLYSLSFIAVVV